MRFKALRHQPSDAARKSGYDNEGQLPDTLPDSRSRPVADGVASRLLPVVRLNQPAALMSCRTSRNFGCWQLPSHSNSTISWVTTVAPACDSRVMAAA